TSSIIRLADQRNRGGLDVFRWIVAAIFVNVGDDRVVTEIPPNLIGLIEPVVPGDESSRPERDDTARVPIALSGAPPAACRILEAVNVHQRLRIRYGYYEQRCHCHEAQVLRHRRTP